MSPDPKAQGAPEEEEGLPGDLEELKAAGDVEGLLALARAYRSGTAPGGRDMTKCFEAYRAAADLGSADGEYAAALFLMNGGAVAQDWKEGTTRLRSAAERGSVPAKVFLGNLYELGLHYKADPEKADVWYRNAARSAGASAQPGTDAHTRELAELGCVRYVLAVVERGGADEPTKARLLAKARAQGYGLKVRTSATDTNPGDRPTIEGALAAADASASANANADANADANAKPKRSPAPGASASDALAAFGYALLFVLAGLGAAYVAWLGARELLAHGTKLPVFGTRTDAVFGTVLALVGVWPTLLVYRASEVAKALVAGLVMAGIGWISWGTGQAVVHGARIVQALVFALPGFVAALLVLGFVSGTKLGAKRRPRT